MKVMWLLFWAGFFGGFVCLGVFLEVVVFNNESYEVKEGGNLGAFPQITNLQNQAQPSEDLALLQEA